MREKTKRCLSMLLSLVLALSMCPTAGFADEEMEPENEPASGPVVNSAPVEMGEESVMQVEELVTQSEGIAPAYSGGLSTQTTEDNVKYIDANGSVQFANDVQVLSSGSSITANWGGENTTPYWYMITSDTGNYITNRVTVTGDVRLIIANNAELNATKGITVEGENSLTIYAQSTGDDMGVLIATAGNNGSDSGAHAAGIGGATDQTGGTIIINGCKVTATGNTYDSSGGGAGIGGGIHGAGGTITINGGEVTANGGTWAAGIGGGASGNTSGTYQPGGDGGKVTIKGGTVNATGSIYAAGIGGGRDKGKGATVAISGGTVTATGGGDGAGIGGGNEGAGGKVTISGGTVEATGNNGAGIGGGWKGAAGEVAITGGKVTATGGEGSAGIGGGPTKSGGTVTISEEGNVATDVTANGGNGAAGIGGGGEDGNGGTITIKGGTVKANGGGSGYNSGGAGIGGGWGGDGGKVTIEDGTVTTTGGNNGAGIGGGWGGDGGKVTIEDGTVTTTGGNGAAGIGGGFGERYHGESDDRTGNGGTVTIDGGTVKATGGNGGAGIGGGYNAKAGEEYSENYGNGGSVTINGGTVTAEGKDGGKGIGAGKNGQSDGDVDLKWNISVRAGDDERSADFVIPATMFEEYHDQTWVQTTVTVTIDSMALDPNTATLAMGDTQVLTATFDPENATNKTVKWSVGGANASAVSLYSDADCSKSVELNEVTKTLTVYAKGVSAGKAIVTATSAANPDKSASCDVTVKATLTYDLKGGTLNGNAGPITKEAEVGSTTKLLDAPTKDGYTFRCWKDTYGNEYAAGATYEVTGDHSFKAEWTENKKSDPTPGSMSVTYAGHAQDIGDLPAVKDGTTLGSVGQSKRLEQFVANVSGVDGASISYRAHLQDKGWGTWLKGGEKCGSTGESRRIEAVQMTLSGADGYHVWYRVHCQDYGWLGWARDGQPAGTTNQSKRGEALEIKVLADGADLFKELKDYAPGKASYVGCATGEAHVQDMGWQGIGPSLIFGTIGQSKRLEAIQFMLPYQPLPCGVEYDVHVQDTGWVNGTQNGKVAGTTGQAKRLEAVRIRLTGELADSGNYSVWYRVHCQNYGWLGWTCDGSEAGTSGLSLRAEAVDINVLPAGQYPLNYDASKAAFIAG